jgi:hypothetical protein
VIDRNLCRDGRAIWHLNDLLVLTDILELDAHILGLAVSFNEAEIVREAARIQLAKVFYMPLDRVEWIKVARELSNEFIRELVLVYRDLYGLRDSDILS